MDDNKQAHETDKPNMIDTPQQHTPAAPPYMPKTSARRVKAVPLTMAILISAIVGFGGGWLGSYTNRSSATLDQQKVILSSEGEVISDVAKNVGKSVVSVNVKQLVTTTNYYGNTRSTEAEAAGTGIIISSDGLIMTNRHVVPAGTTNVSITLSDGTTFDDVKVIGRTSDKDTLDIAFLKVLDTKGKTLTAAKIGDSSKTKVGQRVVAIGNALGQFQNTVTTGILSGYGRSVVAGSEDGSSENLENLFQTDAAINQGNSGGPLVNLAGEVIGVNVAIADDAQSVGFAIPINDVKGLIASVQKNGTLERPYIGVIYLPITADIASEYSLSVQKGAYIAPESVTGQQPIVVGGPAEEAGLKAEDVITKVNNEAIDQGSSLTSLLGKYRVGDKISLTIIRDGKFMEVSLVLGKAPTS